MRVVLEQAVDVAKRVEDDPGLIAFAKHKTLIYRVPAEEGDATAWRDERRPLPKVGPPPLPRPKLEVERAKIQLEGIKRLDSVWGVDMFRIPKVAQERKGDRPYFPRLALWVDRGTGLVVGHSLFGPVESPDLSMASLRTDGCAEDDQGPEARGDLTSGTTDRAGRHRAAARGMAGWHRECTAVHAFGLPMVGEASLPGPWDPPDPIPPDHHDRGASSVMER